MEKPSSGMSISTATERPMMPIMMGRSTSMLTWSTAVCAPTRLVRFRIASIKSLAKTGSRYPAGGEGNSRFDEAYVAAGRECPKKEGHRHGDAPCDDDDGRASGGGGDRPFRHHLDQVRPIGGVSVNVRQKAIRRNGYPVDRAGGEAGRECGLEPLVPEHPVLSGPGDRDAHARSGIGHVDPDHRIAGGRVPELRVPAAFRGRDPDGGDDFA